MLLDSFKAFLVQSIICGLFIATGFQACSTNAETRIKERQARGDKAPEPHIVFQCEGLFNPNGDPTTYYIFSDDSCGEFTRFTDTFDCSEIYWGDEGFKAYRAQHCLLVRGSSD